MLFVRAKRLSRILIMFCIRIICLFGCIDVGFFGSAFILALALAIVIILDIDFLSPLSTKNQSRHLGFPRRYAYSRYRCLSLLVVCLYRVEPSSVGYRSRCRFREFYYVGTYEGVVVL